MVTSNHGKRKSGRLAAAEHGAFVKCGIRSPGTAHLRYPFWNSEYFFVEQVDVYDTRRYAAHDRQWRKGKKFVQYENSHASKYCCSFRYGNHAPDHDIGK